MFAFGVAVGSSEADCGEEVELCVHLLPSQDVYKEVNGALR